MAKIDEKYIQSFETMVQKSLARIEQTGSNIELYIEQRVAQEREKSDKAYAPIIAWTILLGILGLFGVAIVTKLSGVIGL